MQSTNYQHAMDMAHLFAEAKRRCVINGSESGAAIWQAKENTARALAQSMSVEDAGRIRIA